jgi:hypothetical protein
MNVDYESIDELFRMYDVEGLISSGAPDDEYEPEVERIFAALEALPRERATTTTLIEMFEEVWKQMFSVTEEEEMAKRRPDFEQIAEKVMQYFG